MARLDPDALKVDTFATTPAAASSAAEIPTNTTVPYSMLGSCYGCPSEVTICVAAGTE